MQTLKYPGNKLTIVMRDDGPMINCGDTPTYRSVQITLTEEQLKMLALRPTYASGTTWYHEEISRCFIEPELTPNAELRGRPLADGPA